MMENENGSGWKSSKDLGELYGVKPSTIRSMESRKQIRSKYLKIDGGKEIKVYSESDLSKRKSSVASGVASSVATQNVVLQDIGSEGLGELVESLSSSLNLSEVEKRRVIGALRITKVGSESLLKSEQAISKMRENMVEEKSLIDIRTIKEDLESLFSSVWVHEKELLTTWQIRYNLSPLQMKEMEEDYYNSLEKLREKTKSLAG